MHRIFVLWLVIGTTSQGHDHSDHGDEFSLLQLHQDEHLSHPSNRTMKAQQAFAVAGKDVSIGAIFGQMMPNQSRPWWKLTHLRKRSAMEKQRPTPKGLDSREALILVLTMAVVIAFDTTISPMLGNTVTNHVLVFVWTLAYSIMICGMIWASSPAAGKTWACGYVLEFALSLDNLFGLGLVFTFFRVPREQIPFAFCISIYGALILRVVFIEGLSDLLAEQPIITTFLGALLVLSGFTALRTDDDSDLEEFLTVRIFKWLLGSRLRSRYDENGRLFIQDPETGKTQVTLLLLVICVTAFVDLTCAMDSVGAKTAQIPDVFVNLSSTILAIFSLRALFYIIHDWAKYFSLFKYVVFWILVIVGIKLILATWVVVPEVLTFLAIVVTIILSVILSVISGTWQKASPEEKRQIRTTIRL